LTDDSKRPERKDLTDDEKRELDRALGTDEPTPFAFDVGPGYDVGKYADEAPPAAPPAKPLVWGEAWGNTWGGDK